MDNHGVSMDIHGYPYGRMDLSMTIHGPAFSRWACPWWTPWIKVHGYGLKNPWSKPLGFSGRIRENRSLTRWNNLPFFSPDVLTSSSPNKMDCIVPFFLSLLSMLFCHTRILLPRHHQIRRESWETMTTSLLVKDWWKTWCLWHSWCCWCWCCFEFRTSCDWLLWPDGCGTHIRWPLWL